MKRSLKVLVVAIAAVSAGAWWYLDSKQAQRDGAVDLDHLQAPVSVRYDERGVPHIQAQNEADMYRTLGYVHAQDRLFQMEMMRRLANGELAEVFGAFQEWQVNQVVLFSDGQPNIGITSSYELARISARAAERGVAGLPDVEQRAGEWRSDAGADDQRRERAHQCYRSQRTALEVRRFLG